VHSGAVDLDIIAAYGPEWAGKCLLRTPWEPNGIVHWRTNGPQESRPYLLLIEDI